LEIGLCGSTLMDTGLVDLIDLAVRHGFPTITVRPSSFTEALEQGHTETSLRQLIKELGIRVTQIDALTATLPGARPLDSSNEKLRAIYPHDCFYPPSEEACMRAAEVLEAPYVNITHFGGSPVPLEELASAIGALCRRAAARGLGISLEFVPGTGLPDIATAETMIRTCGEPNFRITLDPWHLARSGGSVDDISHLPPNSIALVQLCDLMRHSMGAGPMTGRSLPGEGEMPLAALTEAALANTPDCTFAVEWFSAETQGKTPDQVAARVATATRRWQAALRQEA
jgi:sugar phosphate isomerase/epimerase